MKVFISNYGHFSDEIVKEVEGNDEFDIKFVNNIKDASLILSLVYDPIEKDFTKMESIPSLIKDQKGKKIIFLSWFHLFKNYEEYVDYLSIQTCDLMNTEKYSVVQLPVQAEVLTKEIISLYEQK